MPAIELRDEEVGAYDYEAVKARRERMFGKPKPVVVRLPGDVLFPQKPRDNVVALPEIPPFRRRERRWEDARGIYLVPIGPCQHNIFLDHGFIGNAALRRKSATVIMAEVARKHGIEVRDLLGPWRRKEIVWARHEAVYRMREETSLSFPGIGRAMGGRDHTTALNSYKKFSTALAKGEVSL
jgi:hypothetical protein